MPSRSKAAARHKNVLGLGVTARNTFKEYEPCNKGERGGGGGGSVSDTKGSLCSNIVGVLFLRVPLEGIADRSGGEGTACISAYHATDVSPTELLHNPQPLVSSPKRISVL